MTAYELIGMSISTLGLALLAGSTPTITDPLTMVITTVTVTWNFAHNCLFEFWERRQAVHGHSIIRRVMHIIGFQPTLMVYLIPLIAWWMGISLLEVLQLDLTLIVLIPCYTFLFNWISDYLFGLLASALPAGEAASIWGLFSFSAIRTRFGRGKSSTLDGRALWCRLRGEARPQAMKVCPGEDGMWRFDERIGVTIRILGMLLGTVLLTDCSTSTPSLDKTDQIPEERLCGYQFHGGDDAFLVVPRDHESLDSVCNTRSAIDSRLTAEIQADENTHFRLPAGLRAVPVQGDGICRGEAPKQVVHIRNG